MLNTEVIIKHNIATINALMADILEVNLADLVDDLGYQSIFQWDSLRHVSLMLKLEEAFGVTIDQDLITELRDCRSIREYFSKKIIDEGYKPHYRSLANANSKATVHRGLANVCLDDTHISLVDGDAGILTYRGYSIHDLATRSSFEETAYLLLYGHLPDGDALRSFKARLENARCIPESVLDLMQGMKLSHPAHALRTGISALGANSVSGDDDLLCHGIDLIAQVPILIGAHHAARTGRHLVMPPTSLSFSEYFLALLSERTPSASVSEIMDKDLILHADLSANPASLAARIAISCEAGMHAALTAAISVFNGSLHGGAAEAVLCMIDAIGSPENAEAYVADCWARNAPIMGFGHRIFRVEDPRVQHFRKAAHDLSIEYENMHYFNILQAVEQAMRPYGRYGVWPNVDLYAGIIYKLIGLADDLTVPIFVAGRTLGWVAQALEQHTRNILIYPTMHYVGANGLVFPNNPSRQGVQ